MTVLFAADVPVHYGFMFLSSGDRQPELMETRAGQRNGLCGAAVPGVLSMVTGLHTGRVPFTVEWHDAEPGPDPQWEDVVEVPFTPRQAQLALTSFQDHFALRLPVVRSLRARYCATGMDEANAKDLIFDGEPTVDRYLLALWPADPVRDGVIRQTSAHAAYWHHAAQAVRVPSAEERAAEERAAAERQRLAAERAATNLERLMWGGRAPSPRLRELGGNVRGVALSDRDLLDVFEAMDTGTQRVAARWLARRAFEIAELDQLDWVRPALDAMDRGEPLPPPFTTLTEVFPLVGPGQPGTVRTAFAHEVVLSVGPAATARPRSAERIHRPSFALPAIFSATDPDLLRALVDTFSHTAATFGVDRNDLLRQLRERYLDHLQ